MTPAVWLVRQVNCPARSGDNCTITSAACSKAGCIVIQVIAVTNPNSQIGKD